MDTFLARYADIHNPGHHRRVVTQLRDHGLVTFSGIQDRTALLAAAARLLAIRPNRDAAADGVTLITAAGDAVAPGYAAFTDKELTPHTDGSSLTIPPGLVMLACLQPAAGGETCVADGARVLRALAGRCPAAFQALSTPRSAFFGTADGYLGAICEEAGPGRLRVRLRLDGLARFSPEVSDILPILRAVIAENQETFQLRSGQGLLLNNTRWLHGRQRFVGQRVMLRILGDPLPCTAIAPGFPYHPSGHKTGKAIRRRTGGGTAQTPTPVT